MYFLNKSIISRAYKDKHQWPFSNQVIDQVRGIHQGSKKPYCLGFWVSAMDDLQLDEIIHVVEKAKQIPGLDLDPFSLHMGAELDDIILAVLIGLGSELRSFELGLAPKEMSKKLVEFHKACVAERMVRNGAATQSGYFKISAADLPVYTLIALQNG